MNTLESELIRYDSSDRTGSKMLQEIKKLKHLLEQKGRKPEQGDKALELECSL